MDDIDIMRQAAKASASIGCSASPHDVAQHAMHVAKKLGYHCLSFVKTSQPDADCQVLYTVDDRPGGNRIKPTELVADNPLVNRGSLSDFPQSGREIASLRLSQSERRVLSQMGEMTGCGDSLVIPVRRSTNPDGVIVFGGLKPDTGPAARAALTILGHCAYGRIAELATTGDAKPRPKIGLSPRETEVLGWVAKGKCDSEIAIILSMSERTARFHVANAKAKLDTTSRVQAVTKAMELGLIAA